MVEMMEESLLKKAAQTMPELPETKDPLAVPVLLQGTAKQKRQLTYIINEMCKSEAGQRVIETALNNDYTFLFDKTIGSTYGYADSADEVCALNPNYSAADLITTIAHELRHVQQFDSEIYDECTAYSANVKSNLMKTRVMEADAEAYGCLVSWQLKEQGAPEAWQTFSRDFPEVAKPFETAMVENEGRSDQTDKARTAAFLGWFDNLERRESYDDGYVAEVERIGAKHLDKSLKNYKPERFILEMCHDDGAVYFSEDFALIGQGKYVSIGSENKEKLKKVFDERTQMTGKKAETSLDKLPVAVLEAKDAPVAKSAGAKAAALAARQDTVAQKIRSARQEKESSQKTVMLYAQNKRKSR